MCVITVSTDKFFDLKRSSRRSPRSGRNASVLSPLKQKGGNATPISLRLSQLEFPLKGHADELLDLSPASSSVSEYESDSSLPTFVA